MRYLTNNYLHETEVFSELFVNPLDYGELVNISLLKGFLTFESIFRINLPKYFSIIIKIFSVSRNFRV